ncbi:MAG: SIS domain-containing protein [Methanomassiliicoccaceae archaeon]|nr:SIS domain-containing protein [Methanomassiliicoccaceae archaeon]
MKGTEGNRSYAEGYLAELTATLGKVDLSAVDAAIELLVKAHKKGSRVFTAGNGGSSATASHIVCDFNKGISGSTDDKFELVCLSDSIPTITAIANDIGYEDIFVYPLKGRMKKGDVLIAISGSGNSKNVLKAAEYTKSMGNKVIAFTGFDGGKLLKMADINIHFPLHDMQKSEDAHMIFLHLIARAIAEKYGIKMC